jgi:EAL and modified HD-GYP domain-containing signal transduction protein
MSESAGIFIGRQPILNRQEHVVGYEILFRASSESDEAIFADAKTAVARVIANTFGAMDADSVLGPFKGYFNVDRSVLLDDVIEALPRDRVVIEILEDVTPDDEVITRCRKLRAAGFSLALDDWVHRDPRRALLPYVTCVKVDLMAVEERRLPQLVRSLRHHKVTVLAEKVESREEFERCHKLGFDLYQGFYFARPVVISGRSIDPAKGTLLQLLQQLRQEADIDVLCDTFKGNVRLGVSMLRLVNSTAFARGQKVSQVRDAVTYLGRRHLERWLNILLFAGDERSPVRDPLLQTAAKRGRLMELLFEGGIEQDDRAKNSDAAFLVGMLSLVDALLSQPMAEVIPQLNLADDISAALLEHKGILGNLLQLAEKLEQGDFTHVSQLCDELGISAKQIFDAELEASKWVCDLSESMAMG